MSRPVSHTILLSEASSLSARETITALGRRGHHVEVCASSPRAIGCFSRWVRRVHHVPSLATAPAEYLRAVLEILEDGHIEVLLPVHEQAYLFAAAAALLPSSVHAPIAGFDAFERLQSKAALSALLTQYDVPQPRTEVVRSASDLPRIGSRFGPADYPLYLKREFGTASVGLQKLGTPADLSAVAGQLERARGTRGAENENSGDGTFVLQQALAGVVERVQAIFDRGRLAAIHAYRQIAAGIGGGDVLKLSVRRPEVYEHVEKIGAGIGWHGALAFDYIVEEDAETSAGIHSRPYFIDANPRLVEPVNACLSGADLANALVDVALGRFSGPCLVGREGVRTRLSLMGLLDAANLSRRRFRVFGELCDVALGRGRYRNAAEELTPISEDWKACIPLAAVACRLLWDPASADAVYRSSVAAYALSPAAVTYARTLAGRPSAAS